MNRAIDTHFHVAPWNVWEWHSFLNLVPGWKRTGCQPEGKWARVRYRLKILTWGRTREDVKTIPAERKPNTCIHMQKTMPLSKQVDKIQAYFQCLGILFYPWLLSWEPERWEKEGKPILILITQSCAQALGTQSRGQRVEGRSGQRSRITSMLPPSLLCSVWLYGNAGKKMGESWQIELLKSH